LESAILIPTIQETSLFISLSVFLSSNIASQSLLSSDHVFQPSALLLIASLAGDSLQRFVLSHLSTVDNMMVLGYYACSKFGVGGLKLGIR
jgi:hypothetical protein